MYFDYLLFLIFNFLKFLFNFFFIFYNGEVSLLKISSPEKEGFCAGLCGAVVKALPVMWQVVGSNLTQVCVNWWWRWCKGWLVAKRCRGCEVQGEKKKKGEWRVLFTLLIFLKERARFSTLQVILRRTFSHWLLGPLCHRHRHPSQCTFAYTDTHSQSPVVHHTLVHPFECTFAHLHSLRMCAHSVHHTNRSPQYTHVYIDRPFSCTFAHLLTHCPSQCVCPLCASHQPFSSVHTCVHWPPIFVRFCSLAHSHWLPFSVYACPFCESHQPPFSVHSCVSVTTPVFPHISEPSHEPTTFAIRGKPLPTVPQLPWFPPAFKEHFSFTVGVLG